MFTKVTRGGITFIHIHYSKKRFSIILIIYEFITARSDHNFAIIENIFGQNPWLVTVKR